MDRLARADLMPLERYDLERAAFRARVIAHKARRSLPLGRDARLMFEDRLTVQYQVQEMLRIERIFEVAGVQQELDAYNPLVPDGSNLKATLMFEFPDPVVRAGRLEALVDIEHRVYAEVEGQARIFAQANEGLDVGPRGKTSAVHFLRFEFPAPAIEALLTGSVLAMGIDDPRMPARSVLPESTRRALLDDFSVAPVP